MRKKFCFQNTSYLSKKKKKSNDKKEERKYPFIKDNIEKMTFIILTNSNTT